MVLYLKEDEVNSILTMEDAISAIEKLFSLQASDNGILNHPRYRLKTGKSMLHYMAASVPYTGFMGYKAYTSSRQGFSFRVFLHDLSTGELLSIMEANRMGMIRTGAVTGVATRYMSLKDSRVVGIIGSGFQAEGQLLAIKEVRDIKTVRVYSRDEKRRKNFANEMENKLGVETVPVSSSSMALENADIVVTATTSAVPVLNYSELGKGVHINAIGGNFLFKSELDERTVRGASVIVTEDIEQAMAEAGELLAPVDKGKLRWNDIIELKNVVSGRINAENSGSGITVFKSIGIAIEDIAVASGIYETAREKGIGQYI